MSEPEKIGKYQILERIGRGGMGTIFKAHDPILNRPVALKVISTDIDVTDEVRARFFREAQACARLSHPNIVTVYDMGEDGGRLFIVMELLDGVELRRLIADRAPLALEEKLSIMSQVCDGLFYAHQRGIVHRDIKPGNIMRLRSGQVKILDFGIAQMESVQETLTRTGLIMGTLRYMAPEQIRGRADHRTDIFAVGAVCYEFLSLRPPFSGNDALSYSSSSGPTTRRRSICWIRPFRRRSRTSWRGPCGKIRRSASLTWRRCACRSSRCSGRWPTKPGASVTGSGPSATRSGAWRPTWLPAWDPRTRKRLSSSIRRDTWRPSRRWRSTSALASSPCKS